MADFQNNNSVAQAARVTGNRDVVTLPSYYRWLAEGKIFAAGHGLQDTGIDSQAETTLTPDDVKATFALQSPSAATPLILPLLVKVSWESEGGSATDFQLVFTKASNLCATALAFSGRDMLVDNFCTYSANPVKATPVAQAYYGVATTFLLTVSALVSADMVMWEYGVAADNNVVGPLSNSDRVYKANFMEEGLPHILTSGAAMIFYISATGGDAVIHPYIQWAELEPDDLL